MFKIGDKLPNGATIIAYHQITHEERGIALCFWKLRKTEYVTWVINPDGSADYGEYFRQNIVTAAKAFAARVDRTRLTVSPDALMT